MSTESMPTRSKVYAEKPSRPPSRDARHDGGYDPSSRSNQVLVAIMYAALALGILFFLGLIYLVFTST